MCTAPGWRADYYKKVTILQRKVNSRGRIYFGPKTTLVPGGEVPALPSNTGVGVYSYNGLYYVYAGPLSGSYNSEYYTYVSGTQFVRGSSTTLATLATAGS